MKKKLYATAFVLVCGQVLFPAFAQNAAETEIIETVEEFYDLTREKKDAEWKNLWHENAPTLVGREKDFNTQPTAEYVSAPQIQVLFVKNGRDKTYAEAEASFAGNRKRHLGLLKEGADWKIWHEAAAEAFQKAQNISKKEAYDKNAAKNAALETIGSLNWLGYTFYENRDYQTAIETLLPARRYADEAAEKEAMVSTSILLGHNFLESAQLEAALKYYSESRDASQKIGFETGYIRALSGVGNVCNKLGRYFEARDALETRLALLRKNGSSRSRLTLTLKNLGNVYYRLGDFEKALRLYEENVASGAPDAGILLNIGFIFNEQRRFAEAEKKFQESLAVSRQAQQNEETVRALNGLGMTALEREDFQNALDFFRQSLAQENAVNKLEQSQILLNQAFALYKLNNPKAARDLNEKALSLAKETNFSESLWFGNYLKGRISRRENKPLEAAQSFLSAIETVERLLAQSPGFDNLESLFDKVEPYKEIADLLTLQNRAEEALKYSELAKAKVLLKSLRGNASAAREEKPFALKEAATLLPDNQTALLEYVVTEESIITFLITKSANNQSAPQMFVKRIDYNRRRIEKAIAEFNRRLATVNYDLSLNQKELYEILFQPVEEKLAGKKKLVIIPDGVLWSLPFQALKSPAEEYLLDRFAITYARSLSSLLFSRRQNRRVSKNSSETNLLAVAGAPTVSPENKKEEIPYAEKSVKELSELYGDAQTTMFTGDGATEKRVKAIISNYRVIHFATHGVLNDLNPMLSYLQLATENGTENGRLEANEIQNLNLTADLVILAGCETGRGKVVDGEGVIGLTWAVEKAGASVVIVSQWKVRDKSTREMMVEFHRLWREKLDSQKALSVAEALRLAALEVQKKYPHPAYWAGFMAIGDALRI